MSLSVSPPLSGENVYTQWEGSSIQIDLANANDFFDYLPVGSVAQVFMISSAGADINLPIWKIRITVQVSSDANFSNLPTVRDYFPLNSQNLPSKEAEFVAKDFTTYTYV